ncbi:MAG: hypothetical protein MZV65_43950 [Chromatiales bacterium]|nr:hypothetical protein [Chromatiales bacterium]
MELFSPQGEVKQVRQVTARFAEQMVAFGEPREVAPFDIECPVSGSGRWVDGRNWAYDFAEDLPAGVACHFALKSGVTALSGNPLPAGQRFDFHTGGPAIRHSLPYEGDERIDENQAFILGLDAPARPRASKSTPTAPWTAWASASRCDWSRARSGAASSRRARTSSASTPAPSSPAASRAWLLILRLPRSGSDEERLLRLRDAEDSPLAVLQCRRALPPEAQVKLVWGKGIESASGIASSQDQVVAFKTRPAFQARFRCQRVNRKAQCIPILPMSLEFSAAVPFAAAAGIRLVGPGGRVFKPRLDKAEVVEGLVDRVTFAGPFPERSSFKLEIPADLKDDAGRALVNARRYPLTVRTDEDPPLAKFASRFGIIERGPDAALPVTLRNVEPQLAASLAQPARRRSPPQWRANCTASTATWRSFPGCAGCALPNKTARAGTRNRSAR